MSRARTVIADRLSRGLLAEASGCLIWTGSQSHNGYGVLKIYLGKQVRAHRLAFELARGPIQPGLEIDHLCRNRLCCNPDHLEAVTREENIRRGNAPHMVNARKTACKRGHEFTPENTRINGRGARCCVPCERAKNRARKIAEREARHAAKALTCS